MSSSATFGTFLSVMNSSTVERSASKLIIGVMKDIAKHGGQLPLKQVTAVSGVSGDELLSAVIEGRKNGLLDIEDRQGESVVTITSLGNAFIRR